MSLVATVAYSYRTRRYRQDSRSAHGTSALKWFVSLIWSVWVNQTNGTDHMNQIDETDQTTSRLLALHGCRCAGVGLVRRADFFRSLLVVKTPPVSLQQL